MPDTHILAQEGVRIRCSDRPASEAAHRSHARALCQWVVGTLFMVGTAWGWTGMGASPAGDLFAEPIRQEGSIWTWRGPLGQAGRELNEPIHVVPPSQAHTIWFRWTAPASGWMGILTDLGLPEPNPQIYQEGDMMPRDPLGGAVVYRAAESFRDLRRLAAPDRSRTLSGATQFEAQAGETYLIAFDGSGLGVGLDSALSLFPVASGKPPQDDVASALPLPPNPPVAYVSLAGATMEAGEPGFGTWSEPLMLLSSWGLGRWGLASEAARGGSSVWYRWTAPAAGRFVAESWFPNAMPLMAVYRGTVPGITTPSWDQLERVAAVTNGIGWMRTEPPPSPWEPGATAVFMEASSRIQVAADAHAGETFWIQVDQVLPATDVWDIGYPLRLGGTNAMGILRIDSARASFDDFANPLVAATHREQWVDAPVASLEPGERPLPGSNQGSLWWQWTAVENSWAEVEGAADAFTGDRLTDLIPVPLAFLPGDSSGRAQFRADAGVTYRFRTVRNPEFRTHFRIATENPHNRIENAAELREDAMQVRLPPGFGTQDPGEPEPEWSNDSFLWVRWTLPRPGRYEFQYFSGLNRIRFYRSGTAGELQEMKSSGMIVDVIDSESLYLALEMSRRIGPDGDFLRLAPSSPNDRFDHPIGVRLSAGGMNFPLDCQFLATAEAGEPAHGGIPARASIWYDLVIPSAGRWDLRIKGPDQPRAAVYQGDDLLQLKPRGEYRILHQAGWLPEVLTFEAEAGERLRVAIEPGVLTGPILFPTPQARFQIVRAKKNELPESAYAISRSPIPESTQGGTVSASESVPEGMATWSSTWFHATVPADSPARVRLTPDGTSGRKWSPRIRVFGGEDPSHLEWIAQGATVAAPRPVVVRVNPGSARTIWIQVLAEADLPESFHLELAPGDVPASGTSPFLTPETSGQAVWVQSADECSAQVEWSPDLREWTLLGDVGVSTVPTLVQLPGNHGDTTRFVRTRTIPALSPD